MIITLTNNSQQHAEISIGLPTSDKPTKLTIPFRGGSAYVPLPSVANGGQTLLAAIQAQAAVLGLRCDTSGTLT